MNYYEKYLKYKNKYLILKNQIGGNQELDKVNRFLKSFMLPLNRKNIINSLVSILRRVNQEQLHEELTSIDAIEKKRDSGFLHLFNNLSPNEDILKESIDLYTPTPETALIFENAKLLIEKLGIFLETSTKRLCSTEEFMNTVTDRTQCKNNNLVKGSCGDPSFFNELTNANSDNDKLLQIFNIIQQKLEPGKTIVIVVGESLSSTLGGDVTIYIEKSGYSHYDGKVPTHEIDSIISRMSQRTVINGVYNIRGSFPTNHIGGNNKEVLDKIIELTQNYKVEFINKMCGTCFRSMYYLVHNTTQNFTYEVSPAQTLNSDDTPDIRRCFKR